MAVELQPGIISAPTQVTGVHLTRLTAHGDKAPNAEGEAKIHARPMQGRADRALAAERFSAHDRNRGDRGRPDGLSDDRRWRMGCRLCHLDAGARRPHSRLYRDGHHLRSRRQHRTQKRYRSSLARSRLAASKCWCKGFERWPRKKTSTTFFATKAKRLRANTTIAPNPSTRAIQNFRTVTLTVMMTAMTTPPMATAPAQFKI